MTANGEFQAKSSHRFGLLINALTNRAYAGSSVNLHTGRYNYEKITGKQHKFVVIFLVVTTTTHKQCITKLFLIIHVTQHSLLHHYK